MRALVKAEWLRDFKVEIKMNYYWKGIQAGNSGIPLKFHDFTVLYLYNGAVRVCLTAEGRGLSHCLSD